MNPTMMKVQEIEARHAAENKATIDRLADKAASEQADPEEIVATLRETNTAYEAFWRVVDRKQSLAAEQAKIAAAATAEQPRAKRVGEYDAIATERDRVADQFEAKLATVAADIRRLDEIITAGTLAKSRCHDYADDAHREALAALTRRMDAVERQRDEAAREAGRLRGLLAEDAYAVRAKSDDVMADEDREIAEARIAEFARKAKAHEEAKAEIAAEIELLNQKLYAGG